MTTLRTELAKLFLLLVLHGTDLACTLTPSAFILLIIPDGR